MSNTEPSEPIDIPRLWRGLAEYLGHACSLFGMPSALARKLWLSRAEHALITSFLRALEDILRRLIFIDALALAPDPAPATAPEAKRHPRRDMGVSAGAFFDMDNSETWRVSFKLSAPTERRLPAGQLSAARQHPCRQDAGGPSERIASAPSAQRLEALIRGYNNRERLAAALARKLTREPRAAHAYVATRRRRRARAPDYVVLTELAPAVGGAYARHLARAVNSS